jgi:hypothetical protein
LDTLLFDGFIENGNIKELFEVVSIGFGRSKKTQYGRARLIKATAERYHPAKIHVKEC